jgi:cation:H+ antiporter
MQMSFLSINTAFELLLAFLTAVLVIVLSGSQLSRYGDALAIRTKIESGLIGALFLATVTSLPELAVSMSALLREPLNVGPDLAVGNMLGSNLFNLFILGISGLIFTHAFTQVKQSGLHQKTLLQSVLLLAIAFMAYRYPCKSLPNLHVNWLLLLLPILYLFFLKKNSIQEEEKESQVIQSNQNNLVNESTPLFYTKLIVLSLIIIGAGIFLSTLGGQMALPVDQGGFGLQASIIGTLFLALSTSLPELVIVCSCLRYGLADMAVGNIIGSNLFNLLILCIGDLLLKDALLLKHASSDHQVSFGFIAILSLFALLILRYPKSIRIGSILILISYVFAMLIQP